MIEIRESGIGNIGDIWSLAHDRYFECGYIDKQFSGMFTQYPEYEFLPETKRLIAIDNGELIGTVTITLDGEYGLPIEADWPKETQIVRAVGLPIACVWRLVTKLACASTRRIVLDLLKGCVRELIECGEPVILAAFNPRHKDFYKRFCRLTEIGRHEITKGLQNAPSILTVGGPGTYARLLG